MNELLNRSLEGATKEIMKSVLDWDIVNRSPVEKLIRDNTISETSVFISFVGELSGAFTMKCSNQLASLIASEMLGMPVEPGSDDMKDAVGELLNMIVGNTKTKFSINGDPFKISIPTIIIGEDYSIHFKADSTDMVTQIDFDCSGQIMSFDIFIK